MTVVSEERAARVDPGRPREPDRRIADRLRWTRRLKGLGSLLFGIALFAVSLWVLKRWAAHLSFDQLGDELEGIRWWRVAVAVLFTGLSFLALVGYEFFAVRYVGRHIPTPLVALYSFVTQSVAHAVGFAIFVGATIRYKLYAPAGLTIIDIAKIQVFFTTTFGLGAATLIGIVFLIEPGPLAAAVLVPNLLLRAIGLMLLAAVIGFVIFGAFFHRPIQIFGHVVALPGPGVTIIQILLGVADLLAVAAALYLLLPAGLGLDYVALLGIFVAALTLGLISHIPGSLGVFESAIVLLVQPSPEQTGPVIGALIAFRAVYYILPLILGALAFGVIEARRWRGSENAGVQDQERDRG